MTEHPAVDRMGALARRRRVRRAQTAVAAGALAVVAAIAIPLGVERFTSDGAAIDPAFDPQVAAQVYTANPCPEQMPTYEDLPRNLPDLTRVTAVRYCTRAATTPDALVTGLPSFAQEVAELDVADPDRCANVSYLPGGDALALSLDNGSQVLVSVDGCTDIRRPDGTVVDGSDVAGAFYRAVDEQRSSFAYGSGPDVTLTCSSSTGNGDPVRPGRETLVAALACPEGTSESPALAVDVELLDQAWGDAVADTDPDTSVENPCTETDERPGVILARTDRGDTIRLLDSPCEFLAFSTRFAGLVRYQVPTTMADLTS